MRQKNPSRLLARSGNELVALVAGAANVRPQPLPDSAGRVSLTPVQEALVDALQALVRLAGARHALNPAVLASRKELEQLAAGSRDSAVLHGWRRKLVGEQLQALLAGELGLVVRDGRLVLEFADSA